MPATKRARADAATSTFYEQTLDQLRRAADEHQHGLRNRTRHQDGTHRDRQSRLS
jgi:hypothetical protein